HDALPICTAAFLVAVCLLALFHHHGRIIIGNQPPVYFYPSKPSGYTQTTCTCRNCRLVSAIDMWCRREAYPDVFVGEIQKNVAALRRTDPTKYWIYPLSGRRLF